jgi:hypothetical protein
MRIKIRGGPPATATPSLCLTCRFATVVKGASLRDEIIECSQLSYGRNRITFSSYRVHGVLRSPAAIASCDGGGRVGTQVRSEEE